MRRDQGGAAAAFLTFSLLVLAMALGFAFGRVVIARAYIRGVGSLLEQPGTSQPHDQAQAPASTIFAPSPGGGAEETGPGGQATGASSESAFPEPPPSSDVITDAVPQAQGTGAQPETAEAPAEEPAQAGTVDVRYAVQVGVFGSEDGARTTLRQLTRAGYPARIEVDRQSSHTIYRVVTGNYRSEENARKALEQIKEEGFTEAFVIGR